MQSTTECSFQVTRVWSEILTSNRLNTRWYSPLIYHHLYVVSESIVFFPVRCRTLFCDFSYVFVAGSVSLFVFFCCCGDLSWFFRIVRGKNPQKLFNQSSSMRNIQKFTWWNVSTSMTQKKSQNSHEWLLKDPSIIHFFSYIVCFDYSTCKQNHTSQTNISFSHSKYSRKKNTRLKIPLMLFATLLINHYAKHVRRCNTKRR